LDWDWNWDLYLDFGLETDAITISDRETNRGSGPRIAWGFQNLRGRANVDGISSAAGIGEGVNSKTGQKLPKNSIINTNNK